MRRAFVMGSNGPAGSTQLRYVLNDVENMRTVLSDPRCSFEVESPDPNFSPWKIHEQLANITASCTQDDTFLCYFSGHGRLENGSLFLLWNESDADRLSSTALSVPIMMQQLSSCKAHSKLLILDCCHAGAVVNMLKSGNEVAIEEFVTKPDNYLILMASGRHQLAREVEELQGSFLTANICDALGKKLDESDFDGDGRISIVDLHKWLKLKFKEYNEKVLDKDRVPLPFLYGQFKGDDVFLTLPPPNTNLYDVTAINQAEEFPYQALNAFCKDTAKFFFGRNQVVLDLQKALEQHNFVLLVGASGSGKSSVVRAGLTPRLEEAGWLVLEPVVPWTEPVSYLKYEVTRKLFKEAEKIKDVHHLIETNGLASIAQQIPGQQQVLIIVDQCEEVFTLCSQESEQRRFLELLTQVNESSESRLKVIATLRADFIEDCLKYPPLTRLIQNQSVWIPELENKDLKQVITEPAEKLGYSFAEGLPESIIEQIEQEKNFLPLLQFALTELWKERDQKAQKLTATQYWKKGGVLGVLNSRAKEIYQSFNKQEQAWIKKIFLKLVRTGIGQKDTRQRQPKQKLLAIAKDAPEEQQAIKTVLDKLVDERLLVAGKDIEGTAWVDLAHEALMDEWEQFSLWRQENRDLRRLCDRVEDAHREWIQSNEDTRFLMMGGLLVQTKEKWSDLEQELSPEIKDFYEQSYSYKEDPELLQQKLEEQNKEHELKLKKIQIEAQTLQLEALQYQNKLENKDLQIEFYCQQIQDLKTDIKYFKTLVETLTKRDTNVIVAKSQSTSMSDTPKYDLRGSMFSGDVSINTQSGGVQYNYVLEQKRSLAEAAAEIQQLLEQLDKTYSTNMTVQEMTTAQKMAVATEVIERIESNPMLKQRIIAVLKAASGEALKEFLKHPATSFVIAALEDWQKGIRDRLE